MRIIEGTNVDLIAPFPIGEVRRTYGWNHCYRTMTESDDSPKGLEAFTSYTSALLGNAGSWGIIDKHHITNIKHEAPLVGIWLFEPIINPWNGECRTGYVHVAVARKAFRTGLAYEAGLQVIKELFEGIPSLLRLSACVVEHNFPAKGLLRKLGFRIEGVLEDTILQNGEPQSLVHFGLTRRNYNICHQPTQVPGFSIPSEQPLEVSQEVSLEAPASLEPQVEVNPEPK